MPGRTTFLAACAVLLGAAVYFLVPRFEWTKPSVRIRPDTGVLGLVPLEIEIADGGSGLRSVSVVLSSAGTDHTLASEQYARPLAGKRLTVALSSKLSGLKEGPAVLTVTARDGSWWGFFRGNQAVVRKEITIDITPPAIELIADDPYVNFGGCGLIVYRVSADAVSSGVKVGPYFFPGYKGQVRNSDAYLAFFAHPYDVPESEKAALIAADRAGNTRQVPLAYELKGVKYKRSVISVTDDFIRSKVAPLLNDVGARQAGAREIFLKVNRDLRKENDDRIRAIGRKTASSMLWSGAFRQLSNSKVEANFADARTYVYQGENVDKAYHLGFDLSVTKRYPVEAANAGVVSFVGDLGIYGNTIMIDHGLGLSTLYSHLSSAEVKVGDQVKQGQIIAKTGETGLAVGDHLHFGVYLQGVPVLPIEWWDEKWIRDNIVPKLDPAAAAAAEQSKPTPKLARKRRR